MVALSYRLRFHNQGLRPSVNNSCDYQAKNFWHVIWYVIGRNQNRFSFRVKQERNMREKNIGKSVITHIMAGPSSSQAWGPWFYWCGLQPQTVMWTAQYQTNLALQCLKLVEWLSLLDAFRVLKGKTKCTRWILEVDCICGGWEFWKSEVFVCLNVHLKV